MRGDDDRAPLHLSLKALQHIAGSVSIKTLGRLVEQPERRVAQQEPRQRQTARLTAGNSEPAFAKPRIETCRKSSDEIREAS